MAKVQIFPGIEKRAARHPKTQAELDALAAVIASTMRMVAGPHGTLASRVSVEKPGTTDRYVGITDPDIGAIEFGTVRAGKKQVKGLHVIARTANMFGSNGKGR